MQAALEALRPTGGVGVKNQATNGYLIMLSGGPPDRPLDLTAAGMGGATADDSNRPSTNKN